MNSWVVKVQSVPRRWKSDSSMVSPAHPGQSAWAGNVITPHREHLLPMSWGSSAGQVNSPGSTGTCFPAMVRECKRGLTSGAIYGHCPSQPAQGVGWLHAGQLLQPAGEVLDRP